MLQAFFKTSWKTTCLGALYFCWEIYHEVLASLAGQAINKRNVGAAVFVALMGYVARDWNKSSEDEGLKPNAVDLKAVQDLVSGVIVGGPKVLLPFILAASLCCASSQAMLNATAEKDAVHVEKDSAHVESNAVHAEKETVHVEREAVHTEPITGTVWAKAEIQPGGVTASTTSPLVSAPVSVAEGAVKGQVNVAENGIGHIEHVDIKLMDEKAAAILAEAIKVVAVSMQGLRQEVTTTITQTESTAKQYLIYAIEFLTGAIAVGIGFHVWHVKHLRNQLERKSHEKLT